MAVLRSLLLLPFFFMQFQSCTGEGRLFFGFLDYRNPDNREASGRCCDGQEDSGGHCPTPCDLLFQLSVFGLDGPNTTDRRPSDVPFNSSGVSNIPFQTADHDLINPLTFTFDRWPGCLDIVVEVYDVDEAEDGGQRMELVDRLTLEVALGRPSILFRDIALTGQRAFRPFSLTVVMRYECDNMTSDGQCPQASSQNMTSLPENIMDCPTSPPPTSPIDVTPSMTSPQTPSALMTSYGSEIVTETTPGGHEATTSLPDVTMTSSEGSYVINPTMHSGRTTIIGSSTSTTPTSTPTTTPTTSSTTSSTPTTAAPTTISPTRRMTSRGSDVTRGVTPITTKEGNGGPMEYWAVILGAVLGALVIIAAIGFLIYYRRRQALYKRQEIYTVTPRIVSMVEENGTAGRSDIPVETTEY